MEQKKHLTIFLLAMMNVAIILSLRGLPLMAREGVSSVFYLLFSLIMFLIPTALISAELATGWPENGGVFRWVSEALGERLGFTAIWLQWLQNIFWYPVTLSFAAGALAYLFLSPELVENRAYNIAVILVIYWGATLVSLRGMKAASWFSSMGAIFGTILPALIIICLGVVWLLMGNQTFISIHDPWLPDFKQFSNLSFLAGIILLFSGMEVNAVHSKEVLDPRRSYPKAIFLSVVIIFCIFFLGSMSIASVLPTNEISLTAGVMQAFSKFLKLYHLGWLTPILGLFISFGAVGSVAAWIVGPSKGLLATAHEGLIPQILSHTNRANAPSHILIIQGTIVTVLSLLYLVMPTINSAFFLLSDLTVIIYLTMYLLLFSSFLILRYKEPNQPRAYKVPGGLFGAWLVTIIGIVGALFAIFIGFFPPTQLKQIDPNFYVGFLVVGIVLALGIPQIILFLRKPEWKEKNGTKEN